MQAVRLHFLEVQERPAGMYIYIINTYLGLNNNKLFYTDTEECHCQSKQTHRNVLVNPNPCIEMSLLLVKCKTKQNKTKKSKYNYKHKNIHVSPNTDLEISMSIQTQTWKYPCQSKHRQLPKGEGGRGGQQTGVHWEKNNHQLYKLVHVNWSKPVHDEGKNW